MSLHEVAIAVRTVLAATIEGCGALGRLHCYKAMQGAPKGKFSRQPFGHGPAAHDFVGVEASTTARYGANWIFFQNYEQ